MADMSNRAVKTKDEIMKQKQTLPISNLVPARWRADMKFHGSSQLSSNIEPQ
jgi:hypothetical protein